MPAVEVSTVHPADVIFPLLPSGTAVFCHQTPGVCGRYISSSEHVVKPDGALNIAETRVGQCQLAPGYPCALAARAIIGGERVVAAPLKIREIAFKTKRSRKRL